MGILRIWGRMKVKRSMVFVLVVQLHWLSRELTFPRLWTLLVGRVLRLKSLTLMHGASAWLVSESDTDVINPWQNMNEVKRFVSAFPSESRDKRPHPGS